MPWPRPHSQQVAELGLVPTVCVPSGDGALYAGRGDAKSCPRPSPSWSPSAHPEGTVVSSYSELTHQQLMPRLASWAAPGAGAILIRSLLRY